MSFDPRSLERLRELGRQLPEKLPDPAGPPTISPRTGPKRHRVETEQDPDALFRELMTVSEDGTVPEHLMARLKQLEARRQPSATNPLETPIRSSELPPPSGSSGKGKTTRPRRPSVTPGSEEESLYVTFGQLLLEDDEDVG